MHPMFTHTCSFTRPSPSSYRFPTYPKMAWSRERRGESNPLSSCHCVCQICCYCCFSYSAMSNSFATPRTVAHQVPLFTGFSRQEYWSELPFPSAGDLPDPGIEPASPALAGRCFTTEPPGKPCLPDTCLEYWAPPLTFIPFLSALWVPFPDSSTQRRFQLGG